MKKNLSIITLKNGRKMEKTNVVSKFRYLGIFILLMGVCWCVRGGFLVGSSSINERFFETLANVAYCLMGGTIYAIGGIVYSWNKK